jgi:hypothetical protein
MHPVTLLSVASPGLVSTLSHKGHNFRGGGGVVIEHTCFDFLYYFCLKVYTKKESARVYHKCTLDVHRFSCEVPVILVDGC